MWSRIKHIFGYVLIVVFLIGCQNNGKNVLTETNISVLTTPTSKSTEKPKIIKTTQKATPTKLLVSATHQPTIAKTRTITNIPTPNWTKVHTLTAKQANQTILALLQNNGGCMLPCWFGLTPGQSSWWEAKAILEPFSTMKEHSGIIRIRENDYQHTSHDIRFKIPGIEEEDVVGMADLNGTISYIIGLTQVNQKP
jgi:hypothetical protein